MRIYGDGAISDLLGDFVAYRGLDPADTRLPGLSAIRPGPTPRKGEPAYAEVVAEILRAARRLSAADAVIRRLIVIGDTRRSDGGCFTTLCTATGWRGRALICDEVAGAAPLMRHEDGVSSANAWQALYAFHAALEAEEFPLDPGTVVVLDIDKTLVGAKGRNHRLIDQARLRALRAAVAATLGEHFDPAGFEAIYRELDQARYHPLTEDNQDYVAYLCVLAGGGALDSADLEQLLAQGASIRESLGDLDERLRRTAPALLPFHAAITRLAAQGDPTPFKDFRRREYTETAALFGNAAGDVQQLLTNEIVITGEVWEIAREWGRRGVLLFGLSDKPDEAAIPSPEAAMQGALPLHRLVTHIVGT